jgi:hypothetical protein
MALFKSRQKRRFIEHKKEQNAQKIAKNDQKSALLTTDYADFTDFCF